MNYVLPKQSSHRVKALVQKRARQVAAEVATIVRSCERQSLGQSGFLNWTSVDGKVWGVFENERCQWLLVVDSQKERVYYYRARRDVEVFELHEPGHGGSQVCQKVEQIGLLIHSYECLTDASLNQIENKVRWWKLQRWVTSLKSQVRHHRGIPGWLSQRLSA